MYPLRTESWMYKKKETGKHGKRYVQRDCIRQSRIREMSLRASPKDRYGARHLVVLASWHSWQMSKRWVVLAMTRHL